MLIAIDENGNRILPEKGKIGICQLCQNEIKAYCGEINISHWRHTHLPQCDNWKENETEWHREWKNEFPISWQEVIIERNYEKHIADIKTPNGLVLELQNSSISSTTIKTREKFYGNIIWLINANKFKDNFSIRSEVTNQLRYLENKNKNYHTIDEESSQVKEAKERITEIESEIRDIKYKISESENKISHSKKYLNEIDQKTIEYLSQKYYYSEILNDFKSENKFKYNLSLEKEIEYTNQIDSSNKNIEKINNLPKCKLLGYEHYFQVNFENINSTHFEKCIMVEIENATSLFPNIIKFKSIYEFEKTAKNKNYILFVNPSEKLINSELEIKKIKAEISIIENKKKILFDETLKEIFSYLVNEIENETNKETEFNNRKQNLKFEKEKIQKSLIEIIKYENEQNEKFAVVLEKEQKDEKFFIMKKYKGFYSYYWKHRRKSWDFSEKRIYLDFENHIFEVLSETYLRKISKLEFIEKVQNWK